MGAKCSHNLSVHGQVLCGLGLIPAPSGRREALGRLALTARRTPGVPGRGGLEAEPR